MTPLAREELEATAPAGGLIFGRYDYRRTLRTWATKVTSDERARYLTCRDLRHAALTDLTEVTQSIGAVAAVVGHRELRTTSRYFNAETARGLLPSGQAPRPTCNLKSRR